MFAQPLEPEDGELGGGGEVRLLSRRASGMGDGWAGTALSPPGQAGKGRQLLYAPPTASFPERRSALETKLLIRSHSASCCHFNFHPRKPSAASPRPSAPFTQMQMSPRPLWLARLLAGVATGRRTLHRIGASKTEGCLRQNWLRRSQVCQSVGLLLRQAAPQRL